MNLRNIWKVHLKTDLPIHWLIDVVLVAEEGVGIEFLHEQELTALIAEGLYLNESKILNIKKYNELFQSDEKKSNISDWIQNWNNLFGQEINGKNGSLKCPDGRPIKSSLKDVEKKMIKFVKDYKFNKEIIFKATLRYLAERQKESFAYTKESAYFIFKGSEGSLLAKYCELISSVVSEQLETNRRNKLG